MSSTKYILHGGYTRKKNAENIKFFTEFFRDIPENGTILAVLFASENDGDENYFKKFCGRLKNYTSKEVTFLKANRDDFIEQATKSDAIFLQGGNTRRILKVMRDYKNLSEVFAGKTIAGSSAGAYTLATLGTSHDEKNMREGLGILPLRVVCHYESDKLPPSETSLDEIRNSEQQLELVLLKDFESRVFYT